MAESANLRKILEEAETVRIFHDLCIFLLVPSMEGTLVIPYEADLSCVALRRRVVKLCGLAATSRVGIHSLSGVELDYKKNLRDAGVRAGDSLRVLL